jgi:hypothetical protein
MKILDGAPTTSGNPNQPPAPMQRGAATEGLCALHGSSVSQVTLSADGRDMIEAPRPSIGWDPGRPNGLHHLLTHPKLPRNDATTTENISVPIPPLNPFASMRAPQDEVNDVFDRPSITCCWDPGRLIKHPLLLMHPTHPTLPRNDATTTENISVPIPPLNPFASMRAPQDEDNDTYDRPSITCGWDPGRPNEPPLLLMHPTHSTLLRNDATTTVNISVPIPPLNPFVSMRARQDEDNDTPDRPAYHQGYTTQPDRLKHIPWGTSLEPLQHAATHVHRMVAALKWAKTSTHKHHVRAHALTLFTLYHTQTYTKRKFVP